MYTFYNEILRYFKIFLDLIIYICIIDGHKLCDASNDNFQNSIDYLKHLLQNLPTSEDEKNKFSQCTERLRKDIDTSFPSSSKFTSILALENMSTRRISPWFSPSKMCKHHSIHQRDNAISEDLNETTEYGNFQFPSIGCRKKKKKKVINHSSIAIQEERVVIMQQHSEYIYS